MSAVGPGFVIEIVSSTDDVWWADIICTCSIVYYTSLRPIEKSSVHARLHLKEYITSGVRVCGRQGTS